MPKYKLLLGSHTINKVSYKADAKNNVLELTTEQAKQFEEGRLMPISGAVFGENPEDKSETIQIKTKEPTTTIDKDSVKLLDSNDINLITSTISTVNDLTLLETLYNHEESNKNRQDILDSINKQYESLGSNVVQTTTEENNTDASTIAVTSKKSAKK